MIEDALRILKFELESYINQATQAQGKVVTLGNIAFLEDSTSNANLRNQLIISLVNLEEESVFKNNSFYRQVNGRDSLVRANPPVYLNLYILISAYFPDLYENALIFLSHAVRFFQGKNAFTMQNIQQSLNGAGATAINGDFKLILDLYTLTFEQINHLWGALGGKQLPFVMYKCRLIRLEHEFIKNQAPLIENVDAEDNPIPSPQE